MRTFEYSYFDSFSLIHGEPAHILTRNNGGGRFLISISRFWPDYVRNNSQIMLSAPHPVHSVKLVSRVLHYDVRNSQITSSAPHPVHSVKLVSRVLHYDVRNSQITSSAPHPVHSVKLISCVLHYDVRNSQITSSAPRPVHSVKLLGVGPGQYYGGGCRGKYR